MKVCLQVLGSTTAYVKQSSIKPFVAPENAACHLINCLQCENNGDNEWRQELTPPSYLFTI